jgi:hypothetical protein
MVLVSAVLAVEWAASDAAEAWLVLRPDGSDAVSPLDSPLEVAPSVRWPLSAAVMLVAEVGAWLVGPLPVDAVVGVVPMWLVGVVLV